MKPKTTYLDLHPDDTTSITTGDVLKTEGRRKTRYHRIVDAWPTDSTIWPNRWTLKITDRSDQRITPEPGGVTHTCSTYQPGEGPHEHFGIDPIETITSDRL